jgi:outer membrane protein, multidrug efflux system
VADRQDVLLTLRAEIARNYMELRGAQQRLKVAHEDLGLQQDTLGLTQSRFGAGLTSNLDVLRAEAEVASTQARIPTLEAEARGAIYRIGALLGQPPEALRARLDAPASVPAKVVDVPVGLPSDLLRRRPDVRAAERRIAAANAKIGVATADLYPHFYLTGLAGLESLNSGSLFDASSRYLMIGPTVNWTVFDAGRIRFRIKAEEARTAEASAVYERAVLDALRDVETALVTYARSQVRHRELVDEAAADRKAVVLAQDLYTQGVEDFLPVLDAERSLSAVDDELAQSDRDTALALVSLYKALGGGWTGQACNTGPGDHCQS